MMRTQAKVSDQTSGVSVLARDGEGGGEGKGSREEEGSRARSSLHQQSSSDEPSFSVDEHLARRKADYCLLLAIPAFEVEVRAS